MSSYLKTIASSFSSSSETLDGLDEATDQKGPLLSPQLPVWTTKKRSRSFAWNWMLIGFSYLLVAGITSAVTRRYIPPTTCDNGEHLSNWFAGIDRSFHIKHGNSASAISDDPDDPFANELSWNNFTISTEIGGDEIEDWWLDLGTFARPSLVPEEYGAEFGFDPNKHELLRPDDPEWQPGEIPFAGYPAVLGWQHKLHCIDLLRQASFYNHEYYTSLNSTYFGAGREIAMRHIGHCVDILRQQIMCDADLKPWPFERNAGPHPRNDWTLPKKCRNFESARSWLADHQWMGAKPDLWLDAHHGFKDRPTFSKVPHRSMKELWRGY